MLDGELLEEGDGLGDEVGVVVVEGGVEQGGEVAGDVFAFLGLERDLPGSNFLGRLRV